MAQARGSGRSTRPSGGYSLSLMTRLAYLLAAVGMTVATAACGSGHRTDTPSTTPTTTRTSSAQRVSAGMCSAPQPNRVLHVAHLWTTYRCSIARTLVRRVVGPNGACGLSYNDGFTISTCGFVIAGHRWTCAEIAHLNPPHRQKPYFDVGCTSYRIYASTNFDLEGFTT